MDLVLLHWDANFETISVCWKNTFQQINLQWTGRYLFIFLIYFEDTILRFAQEFIKNMGRLGMRKFCTFVELLLIGSSSLGWHLKYTTTDHRIATKSFIRTALECCPQIKYAAAREMQLSPCSWRLLWQAV